MKFQTCFIFLLFNLVLVLGTQNIIKIYKKKVFEPAVLKNRKPVVVAYYSKKDCKTCNWIVPELERVSKNFRNKIYLAEVDFDQVPELQYEHQIRNTKVPTLVSYKKGRKTDTMEGPYWGKMVRFVRKAMRP